MSDLSRHQFGLRALLGLTAVSAAIFAAFRWLGLSPRTSLFVAAILLVALVAAVGLVAAIARSALDEEPYDEQ